MSLTRDSKLQRASPIYLGLFLLSFAGVLYILINTSRFGAGTTTDSVQYLCATQSFLNGEGFRQFDDAPYILWPPLFPALLALASQITGSDLLFLARVINALTFGLIIFCSGLWLWNAAGSMGLALLGGLAIFLSTPIQIAACMAWSEPIFILFLLLILIQFHHFFQQGKFRQVALAGIFSALACLTRYLGISVALAGVALLLSAPRVPVRKRAYQMIAFLAISLLPLALWLLRNYQLTDTLTGNRYPSSFTLLQNLKLVGTLLSLRLLPAQIPGEIRGFLLGVLFLVLAGAVFLALLEKFRAPEPGKRFVVYWPPFAILVFYFLTLIVSASWVAFDKIDFRLLSPGDPFFILLLLVVIWKENFDRDKKATARWRPYLIKAGVVLWLFYPAWLSVQHTRTRRQAGAGGYSTEWWHKSELLAHLREHPLEGPIFSNNPFALELLGPVQARLSAYKHPQNSPQARKSNLPDFVKAGPGAYLVWFQPSSPLFYTPAELEAWLRLTPLRHFSDGRIYRLDRLREAQDAAE